MTALKDVVIINEMDLALDRFKEGRASKKDTLIKLIELFEEMKNEDKPIHTTKSAKPVQIRKDPAQKEKGLPRKLAEGAADFLFNPERNKGKREMFGGGREFGK